MLARGMTTYWLTATEQASWSEMVLASARAVPLQVDISSKKAQTSPLKRAGWVQLLTVLCFV